MATSNGVGSGSPLASIAARAKSVQRTRAALGIGAAGPNGPVRTANPPQTPAATDAPAGPMPITDFPGAGGDPNSRDSLRAQAQQFLQQAANNGQQVAPAPEAIQTPPHVTTPDLGESLAGVGASNLPLDIQFQRLAGRPPSGRDLAVYGIYAQMYREMGRPPTNTELLYRVTQPAAAPQSASIEPVVL